MQVKDPGTQPHALSTLEALWGVLVAPRRAFPTIAARAQARGVVLLALTISLLAALSTLPKLKAFALWRLTQGPGAIAPEKVAAVHGFAMTAALMEIMVTALIIPVVIWITGAGLLKILNRQSGEAVSFSTCLAVTVFAYAPRLLGDVLRAVLVAVSPYQKLGSIGTNLTALLPGAQSGLVGVVLSYIDPFTLWALGLFSIGGAAVLRVKPSHIAILAYSLWVLYLLVGLFS